MANSKKVVAVLAGHGKQVKGKQSPKLNGLDIPDEFIENGRFREWKYTRVIAGDVCAILKGMGYDVRNIVTEDDDISLGERANRINAICDKFGAGNVVLLEIHANAYGNGEEFTSANGWEAWTTKGKTKSDVLSEFLYKRAMKNMPGKKMRTDSSDGDLDKESNFYVIRTVKCPAVLTENFFYTNKEDLLFMTSDQGIQEVVRTHVEGVIDYLDSLK